MRKQHLFLPVISIVLLLSACSNKGVQNYKTGLEYYNRGNYNKAVEAYEAAISTDSSKAEYYTELAMSYLELGDYQTALSKLSFALELEPKNQNAYRCQGIIYIALNDYPNALHSLNTALSFADGFIGIMEYDILDYRAVAEFKNQDYAAAIDTYTILLQTGYQVSEHHYLRGSAHLISGNVEFALSDFAQSVDSKDSGYERYLGIYNALFQYGLEDEAKSYLEKALLLNLGRQEDYFNKGRIYYYLGDSSNAITNLSTAKDNGNSEALLYLGKLYAANGDNSTAFMAFQNYLESNSKNGEVYNQLGMICFNQGSYQEALSYFKTGIDSNDMTARKALLYNEAITYEYLYDFETAKQKMASYIKAYPEDSAAQREYEFLKTR